MGSHPRWDRKKLALGDRHRPLRKPDLCRGSEPPPRRPRPPPVGGRRGTRHGTRHQPAVPSSAVQAIARKEAAAAAAAAAQEARNGVISCSNSVTTVSDIAASSDGGFTWVPEALPANAPQPSLSDIACPSDEDCFVAGSADIPQSFGHNEIG